jgi:mannosyltransferase OCH1-like enzyme
MAKNGSVVVGTLHQVLITTRGSAFSDEYHEQRTKLRSQFSEYRLWTSADIEDFIRDHFDRSVLDAYLTVSPFAYRADLARYCIVAHFGGWYVDYAIRRLELPDLIDNVDLIAFRDRQEHSGTSWALSNGFFYAREGLPALATAVELTVANIQARHYGITPLSPTGPSVFGQAVAIHGERTETSLGAFTDLTPEQDRENIAFVGGDGWIWAFAKDEESGMVDVPGTNNYNELWKRRCVYGECED